MKKFLDNEHPIFRPLWVRILVVAAALGWAILEFVAGSSMWGTLFGALGAYAIWGLFIDFDPNRNRATPRPDALPADPPPANPPPDE